MCDASARPSGVPSGRATRPELELFNRFVAEKLPNGKDMALDEAVRAFRAYQKELEALRREVDPALERSLAGKSQPFNAEDLKARVTKELANANKDARRK